MTVDGQVAMAYQAKTSFDVVSDHGRTVAAVCHRSTWPRTVGCPWAWGRARRLRRWESASATTPGSGSSRHPRRARTRMARTPSALDGNQCAMETRA
jgi:hypothetical protein